MSTPWDDVHVLNLADDVAQRGVRIGQTQQVVRVDRALGELLTDFDLAAVFHARQQLSTRRHDILADVALLIVDGEDLVVLVARDLQRACDLRKRCLTLRLACLEELGNTRKTVRDVFTCNTAGVERTHRKLRARLTNGLCGDDAGSRADVDRTRRWPGRQPWPLAGTSAELRMTGHETANRRRSRHRRRRASASWPHRGRCGNRCSSRCTSPVVRISGRIDQATANESNHRSRP